MDWKAVQKEIASGVIPMLVGALIIWGARVFIKRLKPTISALRKIVNISDTAQKIDKELQQAISKGHENHNFIIGVMKISKTPMFLNDENGELIDVNNSWLKLVGCSDVSDVLDKGYLQVIHEDDLEDIEILAERLKSHPSPYSVKVRFRNMQTGNIINTECRSEPIFKDNGELAYTIGRLDIL